MVWIEFLICASLMTFFAYNLCKEGIIVARKTHLEESIIGMFFLAIATSFPEIATGATAVFHLGRVGLGYGDLVGSVIVNLMILLALDYYEGKGRILLKVSRINRVTGVFALGAALLVIMGAALRSYKVPVPVFKGIGSESVLLAIVYVVCLGAVKKLGTPEHPELYSANSEPFWKIWGKFASFLVIVMLLGVWMAGIGDKIVNTTGLSQTFTGTLFLGFATSFPEIIVSFAALKAGSADMAVGNILGSNFFDICVVSFLDCLTKGPILGLLTPGQIIATLLAFILSAVAVVGMYYRRDTRWRISWDTGLIFTVGFIGFVILYFVK